LPRRFRSEGKGGKFPSFSSPAHAEGRGTSRPAEPIGRQRIEPFCDHCLRRPRLGGGQPAFQDLVLGLQDLDGGFKDVQTRQIVGHGARRKCRHDHTPFMWTSGDPVEPVLLNSRLMASSPRAWVELSIQRVRGNLETRMG
jgi:hypothetical protein